MGLVEILDLDYRRPDPAVEKIAIPPGKRIPVKTAFFLRQGKVGKTVAFRAVEQRHC